MKVAVIGGGASGMMAAITAARKGADVTIIEHTDRLGKKILSTGNGKCNLTNRFLESSCYRSSEKKSIVGALSQFGFQNTLDFFDTIGIWIKEKNNYIYPASEQAAAVLDALLMELRRLKVVCMYQISVKEIRKPEKRHRKFHLKTESGDYAFDRVVLACGGLAAPKTGSDGSGYRLAEKLGHHVIRCVPALVPLKADGRWEKSLAGIRCEGKVILFTEGQYTADDRGEIQFTDYGISGIPVFQISRFAACAAAENQHCEVRIDFWPDLDKKELFMKLEKRKERAQEKNVKEFLCGMVNPKLGAVLLKQAGIPEKQSVSEISNEQMKAFVRVCKSFIVPVAGTLDFERAQVTCGGISIKEIDSLTMESKLIPGFYLAGEVLDVDGICGGYNLQWAWTSGYLAGRAAAGDQN